MKLHKGIMIKCINEGDRIPAGYGVAYYQTSRLEAICLPIPLNFFVGQLYNLWAYLKSGIVNLQDLKSYRIGYNKGFKEGEIKRQLRIMLIFHEAFIYKDLPTVANKIEEEFEKLRKEDLEKSKESN